MNETKGHILNVALKLFLQKNFKEVTMKEIVDKTGLSKGAFYHYFQSKEKLFEEIIKMISGSLFAVNEDNTEISLKEYYQERIRGINEFTNKFSGDKDKSTDEFFTMNFFSLMFDAVKMFPDFRSQMKAYHKKEQHTWIEVISRARLKGEINSAMNDKQIAKLFMYSSDGLVMNLTLNDNMKNAEKKITTLWDNLYDNLKK